jgi:hypothetical protein
MKAISLWQPWASLIQVGAKKVETRSWQTSYRGDLLICSTKGGLGKTQMQEYLTHKLFANALRGLESIPFGQALCVVTLSDCVTTGEINTRAQYQRWLEGDEYYFGDYSPGRYAWKLDNLRPLKKPFRVSGKQGFFEVDDAMIKEALK